MQTIQVQDDLYQSLNKYSLDPSLVLSQVVDNIKNSQFNKDKNYFNQCLTEINNNQVNLISHSKAWGDIDKLTDQPAN
jgi:ABC-type polysaccharide transport system permease subunit